MNEWLTWGRTSGRDSKMTSRTPIGTVTWVNSSPGANSVRRITLPTMSRLLSAICFNPSLKLFSLPGVNVSRLRNGPLVSHSFKSSKLACRICGCRCNSNSDRFWIISDRWLPVKFCSCRPPSRAKNKTKRAIQIGYVIQEINQSIVRSKWMKVCRTNGPLERSRSIFTRRKLSRLFLGWELVVFELECRNFIRSNWSEWTHQAATLRLLTVPDTQGAKNKYQYK